MINCGEAKNGSKGLTYPKLITIIKFDTLGKAR